MQNFYRFLFTNDCVAVCSFYFDNSAHSFNIKTKKLKHKIKQKNMIDYFVDFNQLQQKTSSTRLKIPTLLDENSMLFHRSKRNWNAINFKIFPFTLIATHRACVLVCVFRFRRLYSKQHDKQCLMDILLTENKTF